MSGKKQHIIPQFIQKKFSDNTQLHFHSKKKCYTSAIKDIYAENCYYSEQDGFLDNEITELEKNFSKIFNSLFILNDHVILDMNEELNKLLLHLFFRNKSVLNIIDDMILDNMSIIYKKWSTKCIESYRKNRTAYQKKGINDSNIKYIIDNFIKKQKNLINLKEKIKNNFLCRSISDEKYLIINSFKYKIISGENFILPDILLVTYSKENDFSPFIDKTTEYILFPISNKKVLFIYKENCSYIKISEDNINEILISASYISFLSNIKNKKEKDVYKIRSSIFYKNIEDLCKCIGESVDFEIK